MKRLAILFALALFLLLPTSVAAAECQFILGFKSLRDLIGHEIVGECLENEHHSANGDALQHTTGGLLVWRKADNWTAFTDGYRSWVNGPYGLEQRFNVELLPWEAEGAIERLPWVQDGLTDLEERSVILLDYLGENFSQVLLALLEAEVDWLPPQSESQLSDLRDIAQMSAYGESEARQIVGMPFLKDIDGYDDSALRALRDLILSNPSHVPAIASHPELTDSRTHADGVTILLLVLKAEDPEAAAMIESLAWVQDGLAHREYRSSDPRDASRFEQSFVGDLVSWAGRSRPTFTTLLGMPWIQDALTNYEYNVASNLWGLTTWNVALAQRVIAMPFLQAIDAYELSAIQTIGELRWIDEQLPGRVLAHPALAGGITDAHTGEIFLVVTELMAPQEAAAIRAFPWVLDGVAESELGSLQVLQMAAVNSQRLILVLTQNSWVQDGLTEDEREVIRTLRFMASRNSERRDEESAVRIAGMPFLSFIDETDKRAIRALSALHNRGGESHLNTVLSHPRLRNGIGDEESALVSLLPPTLEDALELLDTHP